jgi:hypothetical protein
MGSFEGDHEQCRLMQCNLFHGNQCHHDGRYCVHNTPPDAVTVRAMWRDGDGIDGDTVEEVAAVCLYRYNDVEEVMTAMVECGFAALEERV